VTISRSTRNEALTRTSKCFSTLARVVVEASSDENEDSDAQQEELQALQDIQAEELVFCRQVGLVLCSTMQSNASVDSFAEATCHALQWLAFANDMSVLASRVDELVGVGAVESCSTVLRMHSQATENAV